MNFDEWIGELREDAEESNFFLDKKKEIGIVSLWKRKKS